MKLTVCKRNGYWYVMRPWRRIDLPFKSWFEAMDFADRVVRARR